MKRILVTQIDATSAKTNRWFPNNRLEEEDDREEEERWQLAVEESGFVDFTGLEYVHEIKQANSSNIYNKVVRVI